MKNFLFLLNHARHAYILKNLKKILTEQGDNVYIGSRNLDKPHLAEIVQEFGWDTFVMKPITSRSPIGIVSYIIKQIIQINKIIRKYNIDRIISYGPNIASIAAKRNRINKMLCEVTREWKTKNQSKVKLILPVIFTNQKQL